MELLSQVQAGKTRMPPRIMVYGIEGIGESLLASKTPKPIFVQTEDGLGEIDCHKFPLEKKTNTVAVPAKGTESDWTVWHTGDTCT